MRPLFVVSDVTRIDMSEGGAVWLSKADGAKPRADVAMHLLAGQRIAVRRQDDGKLAVEQYEAMEPSHA